MGGGSGVWQGEMAGDGGGAGAHLEEALRVQQQVLRFQVSAAEEKGEEEEGG